MKMSEMALSWNDLRRINNEANNIIVNVVYLYWIINSRLMRDIFFIMKKRNMLIRMKNIVILIMLKYGFIFSCISLVVFK